MDFQRPSLLRWATDTIFESSLTAPAILYLSVENTLRTNAPPYAPTNAIPSARTAVRLLVSKIFQRGIQIPTDNPRIQGHLGIASARLADIPKTRATVTPVSSYVGWESTQPISAPNKLAMTTKVQLICFKLIFTAARGKERETYLPSPAEKLCNSSLNRFG